MIKHILFDFDGTLVDSLDLALRIINEMAEKYHYKKLSPEEIRALRDLPLAECLKRIKLPMHRIPALTFEGAALYKKGIARLRPAEGIRNVLAALKGAGFFLSILSSNFVDNIEEFIKRNDLDLFDCIQSSNNLFGKEKSIRKYMSRFGLGAKEILYVGDELRDIKACKSAGVKIVAVTWGYDPLPLLISAEPDYIAQTPEDILEAVHLQ